MEALDLEHLEELERGATPSEFIDAVRRAAPALFKRVRELEDELRISEAVTETYEQVYRTEARGHSAEQHRRFAAEIERDEWKQKYEALLQQRYKKVYDVGDGS